jgi:UDPglucose 6-dehydrogenase
MAARIAVVGAGYVGLTSAACLAMLGHRVTCADVDESKVRRLSHGQVDIVEPRITEIVGQTLASGHLNFVHGAAVPDAEFVFLCLPTPMGVDGQVNMTFFDNAVLEVRDTLSRGCVVVIKSTVPVGTAARVAALLRRSNIGVVSNPEFLREGHAVDDFLWSDRLVIGSDRAATAQQVAALYDSLAAPTIFMDTASAELVKYAANGFLATKLSYVNEIAELCERLGADIASVTAGMGYDPRIGESYLRPGPGWGGACLPKDTAAVLYTAKQVGLELPLLQASVYSNEQQRSRVVERVRTAAGGSLNGKRIGLLGLAFKAGTNDLRHSPALGVAEQLAFEGSELTAYDPAVPQDLPGVTDGITVVPDAYQAVKDADVVVLLTEWSTFRSLDWARVADLMAGQSIVDTRNLLDADPLAAVGITLCGIGIRMPSQAGEAAAFTLQNARDK